MTFSLPPNPYPIFTSDLRQDLRFGLVLTCRCVRIMIQAGTGRFCLIFFNNLIFLVVFLRAAMIDILHYILFLSVNPNILSSIIDNFRIEHGITRTKSLINSTDQYLSNLYACETCFNFLQSIYNKKQMKNINKISSENDRNIQCMSNYHKKLVDSFKT